SKRYTAPASLAASSLRPSIPLALPSSSEAPIAARLPSPLSAMREPNQSLGPVFDAFRNACCDQLVPPRTNTYAAPIDRSSRQSVSQPGGLTPVAAQSSSSEPTSNVLPSSLSATSTPKESCASPLDGLMYACCDQVAPARVNTYAAPEPAARLSLGPST